MNSSFILLCSGSGRRFLSERNKVLIDLAGVPVFIYSLLTAFKTGIFSDYLITARKTDFDLISKELSRFTLKTGFPFDSCRVIEGAEERNLSVRKAVDFFQKKSFDRSFFVHDAARPFAGQDLFHKLKLSLNEFPAAFPAMKIEETLRQKSSEILKTVNREEFLKSQTPQVFRGEYTRFFTDEDFLKARDTDEMMCFERHKISFGVVEGQKHNLKITTKEDLAYADFLLKNESVSPDDFKELF